MKLLATLVTVACASLGTAEEVRDFTYFLERATDVSFLPEIDPAEIECKEITTYDRTGDNMDGDNGLVPDENGAVTFVDVDGPGVLTYIYSATPGGVWNFYFDNEDAPRLSVKLSEVYFGKQEPFVKPLVGRRHDSGYSLVPMPFAKHLKIVITKGPGKEGPADRGWGLYHHVMYRRFVEGTPVESYPGTFNEREQRLFEKQLEALHELGFEPTARGKRWSGALAPGETVELYKTRGAGVITQLEIDMPMTVPRDALRGAVLYGYWDGATTPAIAVPLGDFFGNGFERKPYESQMTGLTESGEYYCRFPMPFEHGARLVLVNEFGEPLNDVRSCVTVKKVRSLPENTGRFYARWKKEHIPRAPGHEYVELKASNLTGDYNYVILNTKGHGKYVGCSLNVFNRHFTWWGEGDSMIFIDDDTWPPSHHGTGSEEFFNDGWGIREDQSLFAGCITTTAYPRFFGEQVIFRHNIGDYIPFNKSIRVTIEHGHANGLDNEYSSVAYWYQLEPPTDAPPMPPFEERVTHAADARKKNWREIAVTRERLHEEPDVLKNDGQLLWYVSQWLGATSEALERYQYDGAEEDYAKAWDGYTALYRKPLSEWPDGFMRILRQLDRIAEKERDDEGGGVVRCTKFKITL